MASVYEVGPGGAAEEYAAVHEFGRSDGTIPARPYVRPAAEEWRGKIGDRIGTVLAAVIVSTSRKGRR